jgi:hypothetical protein
MATKISANFFYQLDVPSVPFAEVAVHAHWFPDISELEYSDSDVLFQRVDDEKKLVIREITNECSDGYRYAAMYSLWYQGKPFMLVQDAGRSGRDHKRRWLTDFDTYVEVCAYLLRLLPRDPESRDGEVAPDALFYPEEFDFYGKAISAKFGVEAEPRMEGVVLLDASDVFPGETSCMLFLTQLDVTPPPYIRRGSCVMKYVGLVPEALHDTNPRVREVGRQDGFEGTYFYEVVESAPSDAVIVSV